MVMSKIRDHVKNRNPKLGLVFLLIFLSNIGFFHPKSVQAENRMVLSEIEMWKFNPKENVVHTEFPCDLAAVYCTKLNITDRFYKGYFPDGFVLTLSPSGKVLEHYYNPSDKHMPMLLKNWEVYGDSDFGDLSEEKRKRLIPRRDDIEKFFLGTGDLYFGNYNRVIEKTTNLIARYERESASSYKKLLSSAFAVRALAKREIGKKEGFFSDAERAYSLDPNNNWARRAMAFLYVEKGNFNEALRVLPEKRNSMDMVIEIVCYTKNGDIKKALDIYSHLLEDFLDTKNEFLKRHISVAKSSLKPYAERILKSARDYEERGQYVEAIKEYTEYLRFADENEAKNIRNHIATLMAKYPHLFSLPEDARKFVIRAELYTSRGDFEKAVLEYKKAIKIQPFFPALYKALALNYAQLKNYKQAIKNMQIYLELYPDAPDLRAAKDEIYRWELLMEKGE